MRIMCDASLPTFLRSTFKDLYLVFSISSTLWSIDLLNIIGLRCSSRYPNDIIEINICIEIQRERKWDL